MHFWLALSPNTRTWTIVLAALVCYGFLFFYVVRSIAEVADWYQAILAEVIRREDQRIARKEARLVNEWWEQDEYQLGVAQVAKEFNLDWYGAPHDNEVESLTQDPPRAA